ncbi:Alpha/Beta hydrolase protein [Microdochium trichocladiopsis]|uniref:Alpha/Beta hydrolase protein n=1 Tax=Microdochium trichocladiopsis TaxID=1682393 RepID=A0A9P8Y1D7_9PEZI|nr:Alpha/Beta hydrolase protein [Microdochium trichocladiopsis]KAH7027407.1 Alpha/Beta hydrolase protein [Microdochium trichocladiopsis]
MAPDALTPTDPRVQHKFIPIPGTDITYHCLLATPSGGSKPRATILLIHGFPDIALGWRYQVPYLLSLNLRVIVPDMLGYGQTSAPMAREVYTYKNMCTHMAHIVKTIVDRPGEKVLLGGHDWGGYTAWRLAMWYPELFLSVFSFAVHFTPPTRRLVTVDDLLKILPSLAYQKQLIAPDLEAALGKDPREIRQFLNALYNGQPGHHVAQVNQGIDIPNLDSYGASPLMSEEMMDHFVGEYARNGLRGPFNWYRVRDLNHEDELVFLQSSEKGQYTFKMPAMLVMADKDLAFPPEVANRQQRFFEKGLKQHLIEDCSHWIMIERPEEANRLIGEFVEMVLGDKAKL